MRLLSHVTRITGITTALMIVLSLPGAAQGDRSEKRIPFQVDQGQPVAVTIGPVRIGTVTITNLGRGYGRGGLNLRSPGAGSELSTMLRIEMDASNPRDEEWEVTATVEFLDREGKVIDRVVKKDSYEGEDGALRIEHPLLEYVLPMIGDVRLTLQGRRT